MGYAEEFLSYYAGEQLQDISFPEKIKADYELVAVLSGGETDDHANCLLRKKTDGKKYLFKMKNISENSGLKMEMLQMQRLHEAFPEEYQETVYWTEGERECLLRCYQEGMNLEEYAEHHPIRSSQEILQIAEKICNVVADIHSLQPMIIHRDIKPQNLILDFHGKIHLIDFETARNYETGKKKDTAFFGTEITAAPEQYGYAQTDARTDIYAIGKVMGFLLTGSYEGRYTGNEKSKRNIQKIIDRACSFDPAQRYANVESLKKQIARLMVADSHMLGRRTLIIVTMVEIVVAVGALALGGLYFRQRKRLALLEAENAQLAHLLEEALSVSSDNGNVTEAGALQLSPLLTKGLAVFLGKETVTEEDLEKITRVAVVGKKVYGFETENEELEQWVGDTAFLVNVVKGDIEDISVFARMPNLREVYLCGQEIRDITPLKNLPIERLCLCDNEIEDFSVVETMPNLELLYISDNPIQKMPDLSEMESLKCLVINDNRLDNLDFLKDSYVESLYMTELYVENGDYSALETMPYLHSLYTGMAEDDFNEVLPRLLQLKSLTLWEWSGDISIIKDFKNLECLVVSGEGVTSIEGVAELANLKHLILDYSGVTDISPIENLPRLTSLGIYGLQIEDYSPISECRTLNWVGVNEAQKAQLEQLDPNHTYEIEVY